jgi:diguanylate cyclase (GGDEF)-like protein
MDVIAGLGLDAEELERMHDALGTSCTFMNMDPAIPLEEWEPCPHLLFLPWREWKILDSVRRERLRYAKNLPLVLLLSPDQLLSPTEVAAISSSGFLSVMAGIEPAQIAEALLKAREATEVMHDIVNMTREIELEREILSRQNVQLEFLSRLLTKASESLDLPMILERSLEELRSLLPVTELCALFWKPFSKDLLEAELYIPANATKEVQNSWIEYLLNGAARTSNSSVTSYRLNFTSSNLPSQAPASGTCMLFPLKAGPERFGVLALASKEIPRLGNDTLKTLAGAVSHLSLAFKNGVLFTSVKDRADHDGLTRIHNRQHFDQTVLVELKRHQRQGHSLSLLMLDLDHFKSINDTYGHQAGDLVLREMGHLLTTTLRESDYPARYGGEEFVVILPHTSEDQAWSLAERIRRKLAAKRFEHNGHVFRVTTSIGIAGVTPNSLHLPVELIRMADQALYTAKEGGRNMVCLSAPPARERTQSC